MASRLRGPAASDSAQTEKSHPEPRTPLLVDAPLNLHPKIKKENDWHDYKIPADLADALPTAEEGRPSVTEIAVFQHPKP